MSLQNVFKKFLFLAIAISGCISMLHAQMTVTGKVTDSDGFPASNAFVRVDGFEDVMADDEGMFTLEVTPDQATDGVVELVAEGLTGSVANASIPYQEGASVKHNFNLGAIQLKQVVAIGYGAVQKDDLTGSVAMITDEDFNEGAVTSAQGLIQGKAAGVSIVNSGGAPGAGSSIKIRGVGSINLSSDPLIVIDGIPVDNSGVGGSRNILNSINPNDIASMTVLKDASATAIYGARGGNGVVIIETKQGKKGGIKYNYTATTSVGQFNKYVDVLSGDELREVINGFGVPSHMALLGNENTDWQKQIYQNSVSFDNNISALGAVGQVPFRLSFGYSNNNGILKGDNFTRYTGGLNLSPTLFDDHLKITLNARGSYIENQFANTGAIGSAISMDPTKPIYNADGTYWNWTKPGSNELLSEVVTRNPLALLDFQDDRSQVRRFIGGAKFEYKLPFWEDMSLVLNTGYDITNSHGEINVSDQMPSAAENFKGSYTHYRNVSFNKLLDMYFQYNKTAGIHDVNLTGGYSYQLFYNRGNTYSHDFTTGVEQDIIGKSQSNIQSFFGRLQYNIAKKYLLTATLRADATSKIAEDLRWDYFPSVALAWRLDKEAFLEDVAWINNLKLRVGYGEVGNVNGLSDYPYLLTYTRNQAGAYYQIGKDFLPTYRPNAYNPLISWEVSNTKNIALDYGFFNNRLKGYVDFYVRKSNDLIINKTVDQFNNFGPKVNANVGSMVNKGVEVDINYDVLKEGDVKWSLGYNFSYNDNKIADMPYDQYTGGNGGVGTGGDIQVQSNNYSARSFAVYQQLYDANGKPIDKGVVDRNGDGIINDKDRYIYHNPYGNINMGFNTNFAYKNFTLSVVARAMLNNYVFNATKAANSYRLAMTNNEILRNVNRDFLFTGFTSSDKEVAFTDYYVENGSFFRLDNISLGYSIPEKWTGNYSIKFNAGVQNVFVLTNYTGIDPEVDGGIDSNVYPRPRVWSLGLNINF